MRIVYKTDGLEYQLTFDITDFSGTARGMEALADLIERRIPFSVDYYQV